MNKAVGSFQVTVKSEPYDEAEGVRLFRSTYTKSFHGDIEGSSTVEVLRAMSPVETSAGYVGITSACATCSGSASSTAPRT